MNKKQRILVLEDEAFTRNQIKEFLENQEYEVIAPKQPDCFEQWENEQQPDLILLDIGLGSQDGIQLCKRLRKDTQVPIMFVTGENTTQMEVQGLQAGGDDYIRKPFDFCVLLIRIQNLLKRARSEQDQLCVEGVVLDLVFGQFRERKAATGMGLYLAKRLCDRLGLEVKLESKDGQGTTVFIGFPVGKLHRPESL